MLVPFLTLTELMPVVASMTETLMVNVPVWLVFAAGDLIVTWGEVSSTFIVKLFVANALWPIVSLQRTFHI